MKKVNAVSLLFACMFMVSMFTNCASSTNDQKSLVSIVKVEAKELESPKGIDPLAQAVAMGANDFAFKLSSELSKNVKNENFVCSPYSVWLPLAALINATDVKYQDALLKALNASGISIEDINNASSRILYDLTKQDYKKLIEDNPNGGSLYHDPLKIANAIFVDKNVTISKDFAQKFMDFYKGNSINVDFKSKDAVKAVNDWANEQTEGLIANLVQQFDPNTISAIANAIYFSDRWAREFYPEKTAEDVFHAQDGDKNAFYMLHEGDGQLYYEDDRVQAMPLGFKTGGGMLIILPKSGNASELLSSMNSEYFNEILSDSKQSSGRLLLPRFSIESEVKGLKDVLIAMGVPLFDETSAPLTGGLIEENIPLCLSDVMQKAVIKVDEKGTTAAAVTVLSVDYASQVITQPTEPFEMICNKPFVFVLYENTYDGGNQVLFTGVVNNP
ncbi:MAG: hypothetical protein FWC47_16885 [Oscillospiraceae bacterium]|nr:hypothetical protein [Oscillospiraceae bacterium]